MRLRVVVYNVHGFRAGVRRVAETISDEWPDVVLLNEVRFRWRLRRFANLLGMERALGLRLFRPVTNAVLVRPPWRIVGNRLRRFTWNRRKQRGVVIARAGHAGFRMTLASVHLGVSDHERVRHAKELTDALAGITTPVLLGGDLNETPEGPAAAWVAERYWDAFGHGGEGPGETFPAADPRARIDYLFVSAGVRVERAWVGAGPKVLEASDHLPVYAEVDIEE